MAGPTRDWTLPLELRPAGEGPKAVTSTVAIVWPTILDVDAYAAAGRDVSVPRPDCPGCGQAMIFWPGYQRDVRVGTVRRIWVRRAKCVACAVTHALVPAFCLLGRLDATGVIGSGLLAGVEGTGMRTAAAALDLPHTTVRDWWRRFRTRAPMIVAALAAVSQRLAPASRACRPTHLGPPSKPWGRRGRRLAGASAPA